MLTGTGGSSTLVSWSATAAAPAGRAKYSRGSAASRSAAGSSTDGRCPERVRRGSASTSAAGMRVPITTIAWGTPSQPMRGPVTAEPRRIVPTVTASSTPNTRATMSAGTVRCTMVSASTSDITAPIPLRATSTTAGAGASTTASIATGAPLNSTAVASRLSGRPAPVTLRSVSTARKEPAASAPVRTP